MEVAEQWRRQFSLGEPGENVSGSMAVLRARAPGARLSIVRTEWRSTGRTTTTGTTSSTRTVRGMMRGSTTMTNNRESEKLSSPSLVARKPLEISTTRLESDDDSSVEQKYQVSEPSDTEHSEPTSWTRPEFHSDENSSTILSTGGYSRNSDLFNDIDNFIIKPSQLRKCSTISEESLNEVRNRIKSLVTSGSQSNTSDTSESRFRDDELKVNSPVSRVKSFISKMESNSEEKYKTNSIGSKSSIASLQNSNDDDVFQKSHLDRNTQPSSRSKPIGFSSESDFSLPDRIADDPYVLDLNANSPLKKTETFQDWLSKNNKQAASLFYSAKKTSEPINKWDDNSRIPETAAEDLDNNSKSTGKISISIPVAYESGSGAAKKKVFQHSICEGTTVSIESSKPHRIITNASDIFPQDGRRNLAIRNDTTNDPWMDSNTLMSNSVSKTETKQVYNEDFDEFNEKRNKRVEFCKTEVHFAMESGQMKIVETDDKPPPTNNFRRRRRGSTFVPLAPADRRIPPVTLFGAGTDPEAYSYVNLSDDSIRSDSETQYATPNPGQVYKEEEYHTVTPVYEQDVVPRGILKNKPIKPQPYHLGADYELGSPKRADSVWGVKLKPIADNVGPSSGIALLNKSLSQSDRFFNQNQENSDTTHMNDANVPKERIIKVRNERLQNCSLSVYEHLEKLKQSERFRINSSDTESELSGFAVKEKESHGVHVPVRKGLELKTVSQLAPMSPTKSRKLRENELTYFGIQPSPEPIRKDMKENYSELNIDNKPDIIKHTFVNHKTTPTTISPRQFEKSKGSKEPAERRNKKKMPDQPIYINISSEQKFTPVAAPRSHAKKPEVSIEELNLAAGEISKIADQYSDEGSPWVSSISTDCHLKTIDESRSHTPTKNTTERKSRVVKSSTSGNARSSPDKVKRIDSKATSHGTAGKNIPVVKIHRSRHSSSRETTAVVPMETVVMPPARKKKTTTNETQLELQVSAPSDSRRKHREKNLDTATKQRSHCVIPVGLEKDFEEPPTKHENKGNTTRREDSSKSRKDKNPEKRRTEHHTKVIKASDVVESRPRELRGKQLRTPTPSSRLASDSAEKRTSSRQREDRDRLMKDRPDNQEKTLKCTHESRTIRHPVKDGMIYSNRDKRDTSSRDRSRIKDSERGREREKAEEQRERERKKGTSSRQSPAKNVEKKKRLKVTLEIKNPLGPLMKQKNGGK